MMTAKDIQRLLQVDRSTVYRMADDGRLPAIKVGRQWRFPKNAVERFLESGGKGDMPTPTRPDLPDVTTLWPKPWAQYLLDAFANLLGVMMVLTDLEGNPITEVSNPLPYFELMEETDKGHELCLKVWSRLGELHALEPRMISTFADLLCARALVRVKNELKGMVIVFGIAPEGWRLTPEIQKEVKGILEGDEGHWMDAFRSLSPHSKPEQEQILMTLQRIGDILSHIADERNDLISRLRRISQLSTLDIP
jgi:excisionase family DNA binding protein